MKIGSSFDEVKGLYDINEIYEERFQGLVVPINDWNAVFIKDLLGVQRISFFMKRVSV